MLFDNSFGKVSRLSENDSYISFLWRFNLDTSQTQACALTACVCSITVRYLPFVKRNKYDGREVLKAKGPVNGDVVCGSEEVRYQMSQD